MKKKYILAILAVICFSALSAQQSIKRKGAEYCSQRKIQQGLLNDSRRTPLNSLGHSFDVISYTMNLDLMNNYTAPFPANFSANETIEIKIDTALNAIVLNAVNTSLTIDSVRLNAVSFVHADDLLTVQLDRMYNPGETAEVQIYYRHNNTNDGAIYTSGGFLFTDCEPEGARKWFPCWDSPSDKATVDITAKVPLNVRLGSNGRLQDSIPDATSITYHWISRDPVATYLVVITSKVNYQLDIVQWYDTLSNQTIPFRFYHNSNEDPSYIESIIGNMTSYYSSQFADHPFEKNGFSTLNDQFIWGGMENQTLTSLCPGCWDESLVAHEFAHQWFGDMITCGTWADIFLNEGFATWIEAHWFEHTNGYTYYKNEMEGNAQTYISSNPGWPISDPAWAVTTPDVNTLFNYAITYMKGSCVLHQLRYVLGDSLYFAGFRRYAADTNYKYKSATIPDFQGEMEAVSGQDLGWFFDEWIYKPNHPTYKNVYAFKQLDNSKWQVQFSARQQSQAFDPYWQMPIELKINFLNLTDTTIRVFNSFNGQIFTFVFDNQPVNLFFDPNDDILLKQGSTLVGTDELTASESKIMTISPDPFSSSTIVNYNLDSPAEVSFEVYDQLGRIIKAYQAGKQANGSHTYTLDGNSMAPGIYYLRLVAGDRMETIKLVHE